MVGRKLLCIELGHTCIAMMMQERLLIVLVRPSCGKLVWLARPSHLIAGALRVWRDGLAAVTIGSHLFSTNQILLTGIHANSIHSLWELNHALESWISSIRCMVRLNSTQECCSDGYATLLPRI